MDSEIGLAGVDLDDIAQRQRERIAQAVSDKQDFVDRTETYTEEESIAKGRNLGWDVIVTYEIEDPNKDEHDEDEKKEIEERNHIRQNFVWRMKQIGMIVALQKSADDEAMLIKIAAPTPTLMPHAEAIGMEMKSIFVDAKTQRNLYREFSIARKTDFKSGGPRFFSSLERQRLIFSLIEENIQNGGAGLDMDKLVNGQKALQFVPLHDEPALGQLALRWLDLQWGCRGFLALFRRTPLDPIRDYFGEKIALYFAWLDFYTVALYPLAFLGFIIFMVQIGYGLDHSNLATIFYALILCVWTTVFVESWKRRQATLAFFWDVQDFEEEERVRPEFVGERRPGTYTKASHFVDLSYKIADDTPPDKVPHAPYFSPLARLQRLTASVAVLLVFLFVLIIGTFSILAFRVFLQADERAGALGGGIVAGIFNAIFIMVMNQIYGVIAHKMNDWENHRTDTAWEDKLIAKQFSFKFVNSYASLAFIAFIKDDPLPSWLEDVPEADWPEEYAAPENVMGMDIGRCKGKSCMDELFTQLMTLQITMIAVSNFIEVGIPFIKSKVQTYMERKNAAEAQISRKKKKKSTSRKNMSKSQVTSAAAKRKSRSLSSGADDMGRRRSSVKQAVQQALEDDDDLLPPFEEETLLAVFPGVLEEYTELMIQFGYVTLFATGFPLSSVFALFNNILEERIDGSKLLFATQRPVYKGAEDIGTWLSVLSFMSSLSVLTNTAIICFTSGILRGTPADRTSQSYLDCAASCSDELTLANQAYATYNASSWKSISEASSALQDYTNCISECACSSPLNTCYAEGTRIWIFVVVEHLLLGFQFLLAALIPDKPAFVAQAEARAEVEKHLSNWDPSKTELSDEVKNAWENAQFNTQVFDDEGKK